MQRFLVCPVSARNAWHNDLPFVSQIRPKIPRRGGGGGGGNSRKIGWKYAVRFLKPLPYFRPRSVIFLTLFQTWSKIWYPISYLKPYSPARDQSAWQVVTCIKREMVLSTNDEEVANSSKKHTQFKTRVHEPYPISDQIGLNWPKRIKKTYSFVRHTPI